MPEENVDPLILLPVLKKIPLFWGLDEAHHRAIIEHIILMYYPAGYQLFKEGDVGDALYIIKKGQVEIYHCAQEDGTGEGKIADINDGGFFGEMALVSRAPRNACAKTLTDCEIFILSKADFQTLLDTNKNLAEQISGTMISRIKENEQNKK